MSLKTVDAVLPSGQQVKISELTLDQAEAIFTPEKPPKQANREMVAQCIGNANGGLPKPQEEIGSMSWQDYQSLFKACFDLNGFKVPVEGEAAAAKG